MSGDTKLPQAIIEGKRYVRVVQEPPIPKPDATASALVWFFILLIIIIIIVAIIAWIIRVAYPGTRNDVTMRDLCARCIRASHNAVIGRNLTVGATSTLQSVTAAALAITPVTNEALNIEMTSADSSIVMTNASTTPVTVTLPPGSETPDGFLVILTNAGGASTFVVQATGTDTLNGATSSITVSAKGAIFYSMGVIPNVSTVNWLRLV